MQVNNLLKKYGNKIALDVKSYDFKKGHIYAIIGPNGSGKSTLGKALSRVIKVNGTISGKESVSYMSQNSYAFALSTIKNILLNSTNKKKDLKTAKIMMKELGIYDLKDQNAKKLSGGETSKMALARVLLQKKDVIILDEPTASMDIESIVAAEKLIKDYQNKNKKTIILITHSLKQAQRMSDTIIFMNEGKFEEVGPTKKVLKNPKSKNLKKFINLFAD